MLPDPASACPSVPRRALVVDDEAGVRVVIRRWLTRRGWVVDEAVDGAEARQSLAPDDSGGASFDLVICDLRMPALSGPELFEWASRHRRDLLGRIVFSSGDVRDPAAASFLTSSGCLVLEKPFELSELARVIGAAVAMGERAA